MPTYNYKCECGKEHTRFMRMKDHINRIVCDCGKIAKQVINSTPYVIIPEHMRWNAGSYESPTTGAKITTKKQRIEDMAASGCIEYDPGMKQDADRRLKEHDEYMDKIVDETVEREFEALPTRKKELLSAELEHGADIELIRN